MGEVTLVGTVDGSSEGDGTDGLAVARATLELDGKEHAREHGERFVLRVGAGDRVTVRATTLRAVLPSTTRSEKWGALATDPRAELFANIAPGDHVEAKLGGWALRVGQRVAVRGEVTDHQLEGGGPREGSVQRPSAMDARHAAIADADDSEGRRAIELLDRADEQEADRAREREKHDRAARAAVIARQAKAPRPLVREMVTLAIVGVVLVGVGLASWRGVPVPTAGKPAAWGAAFSVVAFVIALQIVALLLVCFVARPPFETVGMAEPPKPPHVLQPSWGIGLMAGFFLGVGAVIALTTMMSIAFSGLNAVAFPVGYTALASIAWLWWARWRQRHARRLARLILSTPSRTPAAGTWGCFVGTVASSSSTYTDGSVLEHLVGWARHSYTNQSTHGPNAGATRRWIQGSTTSNEQPAFTIDVGGTPIVVHTQYLQWGAPFEYRPSSVVATRAACSVGDEVLLLARPKLEGDILVARATGPESLVLFAARKNARATLRKLVLGWSIPAAALAVFAAGSVAWIIWIVRG